MKKNVKRVEKKYIKKLKTGPKNHFVISQENRAIARKRDIKVIIYVQNGRGCTD